MKQGCAVMAAFCLVLAVLALASAVAPWVWLSGFVQHWGVFDGFRFDPQAIGADMRIAGALAGLIPAGLAAYGLLRLGRVFVDFASGRAFSASSVRGFRAFALAVLGVGLLEPLATAFQGLALTWASQEPELALTVQGEDLRLIAIGVLLLSFSMIFRYGEVMADEQAHLL